MGVSMTYDDMQARAVLFQVKSDEARRGEARRGVHSVARLPTKMTAVRPAAGRRAASRTMQGCLTANGTMGGGLEAAMHRIIMTAGKRTEQKGELRTSATEHVQSEPSQVEGDRRGSMTGLLIGRQGRLYFRCQMPGARRGAPSDGLPKNLFKKQFVSGLFARRRRRRRREPHLREAPHEDAGGVVAAGRADEQPHEAGVLHRERLDRRRHQAQAAPHYEDCKMEKAVR